MNPFDAAVGLCLVVAMFMGFRAGLLRSLATIFGYVVAAPLAVTAAASLTPLLKGSRAGLTPMQNGLLLSGLFIAIGFILGALARLAIAEIAGERVSAPDRMAGAMLGAVRIGLIAVLLVLVFDRIIPPGREPAFLTGSRLRPILSEAGQEGLRTLPPDVLETLDRVKRERGL